MIGYDSGYEKIIRYICALNKKKNKYAKIAARFLAAVIRLIWPCDIDPSTVLGKVRIPHALGIVIGETAIIEDRVEIMPNVVIGSKYGNAMGEQQKRRHAYVKTGAFLGANCVILGDVTIGEHARIGAGAIITKDVPPNAVVVGNNKVVMH